MQNQQTCNTPTTTTTITNNTTVNNNVGVGNGNVFSINNVNNLFTNDIIKNYLDDSFLLSSMTNIKNLQNFDQNNTQRVLLPEGSPSCCTTKALDDSGLGDFSNGGIGGEELSLGTTNFQQLHQNTQVYQPQQNTISFNETKSAEFSKQNAFQNCNTLKNFNNENTTEQLSKFQSILTPQTTLLELFTVAQNNPQHSNLLLNACFAAASASNDKNLSNFFLKKDINNTIIVDPLLNNINAAVLNHSNELMPKLNDLDVNGIDPNSINCTKSTFDSNQTRNHLNNFNGLDSNNLIKFTLNGNDIVLGGNTSTLLYPSQQRAAAASSAINLSSSAQLHHPYNNHARVTSMRKKQ